MATAEPHLPFSLSTVALAKVENLFLVFKKFWGCKQKQRISQFETALF